MQLCGQRVRSLLSLGSVLLSTRSSVSYQLPSLQLLRLSRSKSTGSYQKFAHLSKEELLTKINIMSEEQLGNKFNFPEEEEKILEFWNKIDAFKTSLKLSEGRPEYTFYDGPPFATGTPHYG
jgi:hypothetical protein